jgi:hypothetical protein
LKLRIENDTVMVPGHRDLVYKLSIIRMVVISRLSPSVLIRISEKRHHILQVLQLTQQVTHIHPCRAMIIVCIIVFCVIIFRVIISRVIIVRFGIVVVSLSIVADDSICHV